MRQTALGVRGYRELLICVAPVGAKAGFCVHVDPDPYRLRGQPHSLGLAARKQWKFGFSYGMKCLGLETRLTYQLYRSLNKYLRSGGDGSSYAINQEVEQWLKSSWHYCVTCGSRYGINVFRPTICSDNCKIAIRREKLEVRLLDIRQDPNVVEFLLTTL